MQKNGMYKRGKLLMISKLKDVSKKRICLMCEKSFKSKGIGNRRCQKCDRLLDARVSGNDKTYRFKVSNLVQTTSEPVSSLAYD